MADKEQRQIWKNKLHIEKLEKDIILIKKRLKKLEKKNGNKEK